MYKPWPTSTAGKSAVYSSCNELYLSKPSPGTGASWIVVMVLNKSSVKSVKAHYLSGSSEGPTSRGSAPIAAFVSVSEEKPKSCLPLWCMETTSGLALGSPCKRLVGTEDRWDTIQIVKCNKEKLVLDWNDHWIPCGPHPVHRRVFLVFSHKQNLNSDLDCKTQKTQEHTH